MGRYSTGAVTTGECLQIHVGAFVKEIKKGNYPFVGSITYSSGASITVSLTKKDAVYSATLSYTKTTDSEKTAINYEVKITSAPSNLGKGKVYYFICPFTFQRCKILYMGYGSLYFKSRNAYRHRIYYASQLSSYLNKHNDAYWRLERQLEKLKPKHPKTHYKGIVTKPQRRMARLEEKKLYRDEMRWQVLPKSLQKLGISW